MPCQSSPQRSVINDIKCVVCCTCDRLMLRILFMFHYCTVNGDLIQLWLIYSDIDSCQVIELSLCLVTIKTCMRPKL